jgi:methionine-S-sulfoxide reductase
MAKAYFSAGCFWGVEYYFKRLKGVTKTVVGFMGGELENPSYKQVKTGTTGHLETIEVEYDPDIVSYETLVRYFFEIHDFEQVDGQGIDIGTQYLSAIWFNDTTERDTAINVFGELMQMGYSPVTQIRTVMSFYPAEDYHQDYLDERGETPECHVYTKIF